jgi:hypothetical protein
VKSAEQGFGDGHTRAVLRTMPCFFVVVKKD